MAPVLSASHWRPAALQTGCWSMCSAEDLSAPNLLIRAHPADCRLQQIHHGAFFGSSPWSDAEIDFGHEPVAAWSQVIS